MVRPLTSHCRLWAPHAGSCRRAARSIPSRECGAVDPLARTFGSVQPVKDARAWGPGRLRTHADCKLRSQSPEAIAPVTEPRGRGDDQVSSHAPHPVRPGPRHRPRRCGGRRHPELDRANAVGGACKTSSACHSNLESNRVSCVPVRFSLLEEQGAWLESPRAPGRNGSRHSDTASAGRSESRPACWAGGGRSDRASDVPLRGREVSVLSRERRT